MSTIASVTSIAAPHSLSVEDIAATLRPRLPESARMRFLAPGARSTTRGSALSLRDLVQPRTSAEREALFEAHGARLAEAATRALLGPSRVDPRSLSALVCVSSTGAGLAAIAARVARAIGLDPLCRRITVDGLGCAGGLSALGLASDLIDRAGQGAAVVVCVELPSLSFPAIEPSTSDALAALHYGDAVAAMLVRPEGAGRGIEVLRSASLLLPPSSGCGAFRRTDTGVRVSGSAGLPRLIRRELPEFIDGLLGAHGIERHETSVWLVQPRGSDVLEATAACLALPEGALAVSRGVFERYGNAVSASLPVALQTVLEDPPAPGSFGVLLSFGPAPSLDAMLLRWPSEAI